MKRPPTIITIDVEEWFHGHNYLNAVEPSTWDRQEERVVANVELCLEMLARHDILATFFVLGWTAARHPDLVARIAAAGHEIGCHSHAHPLVHRLTEAEFRDDTCRARDALSAAGADRIVGYRAPSFSLLPPVYAYLHILRELGFGYDCSIFPVHHPRYGQPSAARRPFRVGDGEGHDLVAVPMTTARFAGVNVGFSGGGYLRLLPLAAYRFLGAVARRQGQPVIVYFHPWELDSYRPDVGLSGLARLRSQGGQDTLARKVEAILGNGSFQTLGDYVSGLTSVAHRSIPR